jgi:predicted nicotinamide N-methyase
VAHWMVKVIVQRTLSLVPQSQSWNYLFQKHVTRSLALDEERFQAKLLQARRHLENYFLTRLELGAKHSVLELGTGWYPVIPIAFYLCGASKVWTIDKQSLLRVANVKRTLELFAEFANRGKLMAVLPWIRKDRVDNLVSAKWDGEYLSAADILGDLNIGVMVTDARCTGLKTASIDFLLSNSVLQEIPAEAIAAIFEEFSRLAAPAATMSHYVNMVEPYVDFDHSLTPYYFLRFSDPMWNVLNNSLHFHNRLRIPDYRTIHELAGFAILKEDNELGEAEDLGKVPLSKKFQCYSRDDLLVTRSWIVSTPNQGTPTRYVNLTVATRLAQEGISH